jgi:serine/threonine protein kinase
MESDATVGGRLIQEGSYGCAFTPPLPCKKSKKGKGKQVGKVLRKKDAEIELRISTLVEGIPGHARYFLTETQDNCTSKNFSNLREEYASMCKVYAKMGDNELIQLLSSFGGRSLEKTPITDSFDFLGTFRHMLEGVVLLHKQDVCHCDIHEGNVLIAPNGTGRFIDFGAAFVGHAISENTVQQHNYIFNPAFDPQPPELAVQNAINNRIVVIPTPPKIDLIHDKVSVEMAIYRVIHEKKIFQKASTVLGLSLAKQERDLEQFWHVQDRTWTGDSWVLFYKTYWRTWDAFSLGVMFFKVLLKCLMLPSFIKNVWNRHSAVLTNVFKGLLQANPLQRMSVEDALEQIKPLT